MPTARRFGADFGLQQPESGAIFVLEKLLLCKHGPTNLFQRSKVGKNGYSRPSRAFLFFMHVLVTVAKAATGILVFCGFSGKKNEKKKFKALAHYWLAMSVA